MAADITWRAHGGNVPLVSFDQQLDKFALWIETWTHAQRCELIEKLLIHMDYEQYRFLWTVMQPTLHRDFMYTAQMCNPGFSFQPLSTHNSRKLRAKLGTKKRNNFHRVRSAYCEFPEEILQKNTLPELRSLRALTMSSQIRRKTRPHCSATLLPAIANNSRHPPSMSASGRLFGTKQEEAPSPLTRFIEQPVRRHIQKESIVGDGQSEEGVVSLFKGLRLLPPNAMQVVDWYAQWNDSQRNEFIHKLLLKLDEKQHFFISNLLMIKQHKDFITLLPLHVTLKILSYLKPKELIIASRVSRPWKKMCERNEVWKAKCKELNMSISNYSGATNSKIFSYKKIFKDYLHTTENWSTGKYREIELKGHSKEVLCVCLEEKKSRLASGSADKSIRVWDAKTGQCLVTLKGHLKGVWCLNFFTSTMLISGSFDTTIRIWNLTAGKTVKTLLGHDGAVWSICRRGNTLVSGSQDRSVKVWDIRRCLLTCNLLGHQAAVFCVDMDAKGEHAFSSSADHTVRIWGIADGTCKKVIYANQTMAVMSVSYSSGHLACSYGEMLCVYEIGEMMETTKLIRTYEEHHKRVESVSLTMTGGGVLVSAGKDGLIKYWHLDEDASVQTFKGSTDQITCVTFDKHRIVLAGKENRIKIFDFSPAS